MIDIHLVRDGDVELIENQRPGYVPAEIGSAFHNRDRTRAPAFIRRLELRGAPSANVGIRSRLKAVA